MKTTNYRELTSYKFIRIEISRYHSEDKTVNRVERVLDFEGGSYLNNTEIHKIFQRMAPMSFGRALQDTLFTHKKFRPALLGPTMSAWKSTGVIHGSDWFVNPWEGELPVLHVDVIPEFIKNLENLMKITDTYGMVICVITRNTEPEAIQKNDSCEASSYEDFWTLQEKYETLKKKYEDLSEKYEDLVERIESLEETRLYYTGTI